MKQLLTLLELHVSFGIAVSESFKCIVLIIIWFFVVHKIALTLKTIKPPQYYKNKFKKKSKTDILSLHYVVAINIMMR